VKLCIHAKMLGESRHLIQTHRNGAYAWTVDVPDDAWTLGAPDSPTSLEELTWGLGEEIAPWPHPAFRKSIESILGKEHGPVRWSQILPSTLFKESLQELLAKLWDILESEKAITYGPACLKAQKLLSGFGRAKVDLNSWREARDEEARIQGQLDVVESFRPTNGFAATCVYNRMTTTGRAHVVSGPKILNLKRRYRGFLRSQFDGGRIIIADYVSLEPRVMLAWSEQEGIDDVYGVIKKNLTEDLTRDQIKVVTMGVLFGIGLTRLKTLLGPVDVVRTNSEIRDFFKVKGLESTLERDYKNEGHIKTAYGRFLKPVRTDSAGLVSYYVQGTGADLAFEGFSNIVDEIRRRDLPIIPLFNIHDALVLDASPQVTKYDLEEIIRCGEEPSCFPCRFPIEMKILE
jgi:hypothetical protein